MCGSMIFTEKILKPMNKPAKLLRGKSGGCIVNATQFGNPVALSAVEGPAHLVCHCGQFTAKILRLRYAPLRMTRVYSYMPLRMIR